MHCEELKIKIDLLESIFTLRQNWQVDGRKAEYFITLRDKESNFGKIVATFEGGNITISAHLHLYNNTKFHLIFENTKNHETFESVPERPMLLTFKTKHENFLKDYTMAVKGHVAKPHPLTSFHQFKVFELDVSEKSSAKFIASRETQENFVQIKISSHWMLQNNTDKEYLFRENSVTDQEAWIKAGPKQTVPFYSSLDEPILVLRDSLEACQTEPFKIATNIDARTLRLTSKVCFLLLKYIYISKSFVFQSGANVKYSRVYGKPNTVEIEETCEDSVPFTFENHCNELTLKLKQKGEKQVWLMYKCICSFTSCS